MKRTIIPGCAVAVTLLMAAPAAAQVDLAQPAGRQIVDGVSAGARAGLQLDRGDLNGDINNKELVIGAPDWSSDTGRVYVILGWVKKTGDFDLNAADITITGGSAGDLFGRGTAVGFVRTIEQPQLTLQTTPRDLVIGAPGAFGGKGAVYLFDGPLTAGALSTANASLTIIGRAGDQLGRALGTADLNHDGFREIVAGAPGNGRAYVIDAHTAHGTIDLSTTPPLSIFSAPGIGSVFYGGDVSGDGIQDIAIGAPTANSSAGVVYVVKGRSSSAAWTPTLDLTTSADGVFVGANANDQAGASLWMAHVDSDQVMDLIVGAPGVSALGRTSAGQAYIFWGGPSTTTSRPVIAADVNITGAASGAQLGASISAGNITRNVTEDIALLSPGANSGRGEITVFYGRARSAFPTSIDTASSADRRIRADAAGPPIQQVIVWDVLGQSSDAVVAAAPTATTAAGANAGRLYFSLSPTLEASGTTVVFHSVANRPSALHTTTVTDRGAIPLQFTAATNAAWLGVTSSGSVGFGSPALVGYAIIRPLTPGIYHATITLTAASDLGGVSQIAIEVHVTYASTARRSDFDGDGRDDVAVFRHADGTWTALHGAATVVSGQAWGATGDVPVAGDFDGDGRADLAVFRPSTGTWFIKGGMSAPFGMAGDIPVPADYDGDGRTDVAVFRPSSGAWYVLGQNGVVWGAPGDVPVPGDYVGAGYAAPAVFRHGTWFMPGQNAIAWGLASDIPVPADYDGDGRTDIAVYRPSNGTWYVRNQFSVRWGAPGDIPIPQDIDGDGHVDLVVYRPSTGVAYILNPMTGASSSIAFAKRTDVPVLALARTTIGDADADGRTDLVMFRPGDGTWRVRDSSTQTAASAVAVGSSGDVPVAGDFLGTHIPQPTVFRNGSWIVSGGPTLTLGTTGDIPAAADYDGDGRTDAAVFHNGTWTLLYSAGEFTKSRQIQWGTTGDVPVAGDYDGDGRADAAVFRNGAWYILTSSSNFTASLSVLWGTSGDIAVPGDYDGDGKTDPAVFRGGIWYILTSSSGYQSSITRAWGASTDVPVPGDYDGDGLTDVAVYRPDTNTWYVFGQFSAAFGASGDVPVLRR